MTELIPVNIIIGDRPYRIRILPKDEEVVRKTVKVINEKILEFKTQFAGKDMQDYISMVLVWFATEQNGALSADLEKEDISEKLAGIEKLLDAHLKES
ncbi:MAG TPA: cell division protein ZapA [Chitinophagaceae bacterium]|jgi:cell division protein ZapA|nr:cell division protein ZapA [Chitinophagaceae bacterium]